MRFDPDPKLLAICLFVASVNIFAASDKKLVANLTEELIDPLDVAWAQYKVAASLILDTKKINKNNVSSKRGTYNKAFGDVVNSTKKLQLYLDKAENIKDPEVKRLFKEAIKSYIAMLKDEVSYIEKIHLMLLYEDIPEATKWSQEFEKDWRNKHKQLKIMAAIDIAFARKLSKNKIQGHPVDEKKYVKPDPFHMVSYTYGFQKVSDRLTDKTYKITSNYMKNPYGYLDGFQKAIDSLKKSGGMSSDEITEMEGLHKLLEYGWVYNSGFKFASGMVELEALKSKQSLYNKVLSISPNIAELYK